MESLIEIFCFAALASCVQRVTGFGFGIIMMSLLPFLMPTVGEATALCGMLAVLTAMMTAVKMRRYVCWKRLLPILLTFLLVSYFAVGVVSRVDSSLLKKALGVVLIGLSVYFFFISDRVKLNPTMPVQIGLGTASGIMGGLFAMQGPPAVLYFIASCKSREEYIAETQWFFFIGNLMMTMFRAANGFVTRDVVIDWAVGAPAVFAGIWIGARISGRISHPLLRKIVYVFLAISGLIALI